VSAVLREAATVALMRDRPGTEPEVLLVQRQGKDAFAGGAFVFPGGILETRDCSPEAFALCAGLRPEDAANILRTADSSERALGYFVAAIRETFEEVGLLLAYGPDGGPARVDPARLGDHRRACQAENRAFWDMVRAERLTLATDRLVHFAHWITPETQPLRFDTRFFATPAPAGQDAVADAHEITEVRWLAPREALEANRRGELPLRVPTIKNLGLLDGTASAAEALRRLEGRAVPTIMPRVIVEGGTRRVLLPGEPGYA